MSDWFAANRQRALDDLFALLRIQSVSTDPAFLPEIARAQDFLQAHLTRAGFEHVQLVHGPGHACVYADWLHAPGKPTLLVYGHYDVQPADPVAKWKSPPFEPTVRDGRVYARGASDDKGPLFVALTALAGMLATGALACNVKLLIEGEEELGSRHLGETAAAHRELLACDFLLSADGARWRPDLPAVNVGNRGIVTLEFGLTTAAKDLHSGRYGGTVANALNAIAGLVATLHDARGRVAVDGFYDGVAEPTNSERAELAALPFDDAAYYEAVGASEPVGESGYSTLERQWLRPTLDLNGLWGGYQGVGGKTVIPCEAFAKISCRLVPGQAPDRMAQLVRAHLERNCPKGARLSFEGESHGSPAYALPPDHPALLTVEDVFTEVNGQRPVRVRIGATLPIGTMFHEALGIDTVMFSFATADEDFHAPNEFFRLASFDEGVRAWRLCLERLGRQTAETYRAFRRN